MKYKVIYLKTNKDDNVPYLSDYNLNTKDIVMVEGLNDTYEVLKVSEFDNDSMPYDVSKLKKVTSVINKDINDLIIDFKALPIFSLLDYHTDMLVKEHDMLKVTELSFIKSLKVINLTNNNYNNLKLKFEFSNPNLHINDILIGDIKPNTEEPINNPFIHINLEGFYDIKEITTSTLEISISDDINTYSRFHHIFTLLPINIPSIMARYDFRMYLKYINQDDLDIKEYTKKLIEKNGVFKGYKNKDIEDAKNEINIIYNEIKDLNIKFIEKASLYNDSNELYSNKINTNKEVLENRLATSLDLSLLFSSILLNLGFNPIITFTKTNVFIGVYLKDINRLEKNIYDEGVLTSNSILYNYVTGSNDLILIDLTNSDSLNNTLDENIKKANDFVYKYDNIFYSYDIRYLQNGVFKPLPRYLDNDFEVLISNLENNDYKTPVREVKFIESKEEIIKDRFTFWEKKLLDLSEANPLVNFNIKSTNSIRLTSNADLDLFLYDNDQLKIDSPIKTSSGKDLEFVLNSNKKPNELNDNSDNIVAYGDEKTLKNIISKSKSATEETGAPTLYLIMGLLKYKRLNGENGNAPFMVLPVKINKNKNKSGYTINYDMDLAMVNQTFFEYYQEINPDCDYSNLYNINNEKYIDICHTFKVLNNNDIILDSNMFILANLTFSHYIMWLDMKKRKNELKKNKLVESIIENRNLINDVDLDFGEENINLLENYNNFAAPLPYDSTQLKAILDCGNGKSFILDGPPGTGKSQTIVNMIVNSFFNGKTVLFVAEKKAALDVVYDRLKKLKLDRFALELHSNKANKSDFFMKLKSSMEIGKTVNPTEFEDSAKELEIKKIELIDTINKMHKHKYFMSLYDSITEIEYNNYPELELDMNYLINYDLKKDKDIKELLSKFISLSKEINNFKNTPLKYIGINNANFFEIDNINNEFRSLAEIYDDLIYDINRLFDKIGISVSLNQMIILNLLEGINLSINEEIYSENINKFFNEFNLDIINNIFNKSEELLNIESKNDFNKELLLNINASERINELNNTTGFFKKHKLNRRLKKELNGVFNSKLNKNLKGYYELILKYNDLYNYIKENSKELNSLINLNYLDNYKDLESIKNKFFNTLDLKDIINKLNELEVYDTLPLFVKLNQEKDLDLAKEINKINNDSDNYSLKENELSKKYNIRYDLLDMDNYNKLLSFMVSNLEKSELITMTSINDTINHLNDLGLKVLTDSIINSTYDINDIPKIYDKSLAMGYIKIYFMDDDINYFNPSLFDSEIKKYRDLINDYNNYAIEEVSARISDKLIHDSIKYMESSPIGRLKKAIQSSGRGVTIRETLREYDTVIKKYFPVFLMSPLSVAQYLAMDDEFGKGVSKFDVVIFDEASQIPTHEAIGSIARGNSLIVSGDPNQMPPSSYFQTGITISDDDLEFIDADSLLNECLAISLPRHRLKFHYRSRHESLIQFSNDKFYDSSLYTFPSIDSNDFKISFDYVKPDTEKKNSNMSDSEANQILEKINEIYSDPKNHGKSLGIIVFNITQEETLDNKLQSYLIKHPKLKEELAYSEEVTSEPYFIKSLENVQGDERDIIILSIGFRKNSLGHPYINGPLVRVNGEKRLNVAVSRSKEEMHVISTIKFEDFEADERIQSLGAKTLKAFLGYAEFKSFNAKLNFDNKEKLANLLASDLKEYGIEAECGIGSGNVKVDLAIKKKGKEDYSLGVLIDNQVNNQTLSLRDRLYVNEYVLNNLGWNVLNIYSVEIFKNRKAVIDKIIKALDDPYIKKTISINPDIKIEEKKEFSLKAMDYMDAVLVRAKYDKEKGFSNLDTNLNSIVSIESPVSFNRIKTIIRDNYGLKSITKSISDSLLEALMKKYYYTIDQNGERFFWIEQNTYMSSFRKASKRDIYDVSKEELACCMREILKLQEDLDLDDLYKALLEAFEFDTKVLNKRVKERLSYVYDYGQKDRLI